MLIPIETFNGAYCIECIEGRFQVQLNNNDEVVFNTEAEAKQGIYMDVLNCLWDDPVSTGRFVSSDSLQEMISYINGNDNRKRMFISLLHFSDQDNRAIIDVLSEGWYERFDRYDSDVAEQFISFYQNFREIYIRKYHPIYTKEVIISQKLAGYINHLLTEGDEDFNEDCTITKTAKFDDGTEMDIKCCGVRYEEGSDNSAWTECVLFRNGSEVFCSEPSEDFLGEWTAETDDARYIANVIVK